MNLTALPTAAHQILLLVIQLYSDYVQISWPLRRNAWQPSICVGIDDAPVRLDANIGVEVGLA